MIKASDLTNNTEKKKVEAFIAMGYDGIPDDDEKFLSDSYYGDGGYKDGSYVIPHPRETPLKYMRRRMIAYFFNYIKPCVDGNVNPIFKELPVRGYNTSNHLFERFLSDCDLKGSSLDKFMKDAALGAKLYGVQAIFIDNFPEEELSKINLLEAVKERKFPYLYTLENNQIKDYAFDHAGRLIMLTIQEKRIIVDEDNNRHEKEFVWTWTLNHIFKTIDGISQETLVNKIGIIPVVFLYGTQSKKNELKPTSGFYQIAKTNLALYNACSELRELLRSQAFNILTYGIGEDDNYDKVKEIVASTENIMCYRGNLNAPAYISPSSAPAEMLMNEINMLIQEIYRMANLSSVTGVKTEISGAAKEWDFESTNTTLSEFAKNIEQAEIKIANIFGQYVGSDLEFTSKYSNDFGIVDTSAKLDEITKALSLMIGGSFDCEVKKQAARVVFKNQDDALLNKITNDIDIRFNDELNTKVENIDANEKLIDEM